MFDETRLITQRLRDIDASGIRKVFDLAATATNPINLSIGQPHFDVPEPIRQAAVDAIHAGRNSYTVTQGIAELRERVEQTIRDEYAGDGRWDEFGTLITSGVSGGLVLALLTCVEPGDEVLIPDPYFVMYKHLVTMAGGKAVFLETYPSFEVTAEQVEAAITDRTKLLILSSPSNPTGVVIRPDVLQQLVEVCERRNVLLISDEIYNVFCYEKMDTPAGPRCPSPASYSDHLLVMRGFSKTYAMTGWRLGYVVGPKEVVDEMTKLQQYTFVCAPSMVQHAGLAALDVEMTDMVEAYRRKRDMVQRKLTGHFELSRLDGAFYAFIKAPTGETGTAFVERAIAQNLLIIPGNVFSEADTHFRISYACDDAVLEKGLDLLVDLADGR